MAPATSDGGSTNLSLAPAPERQRAMGGVYTHLAYRMYKILQQDRRGIS